MGEKMKNWKKSEKRVAADRLQGVGVESRGLPEKEQEAKEYEGMAVGYSRYQFCISS